MGQFLLGLQTLLRVWSDADFAARVGLLLEGKPTPDPVAVPAAPVEKTPAAPAPAPVPVPTASRHEALSLLSVLQREGRLIDFLKEPITGFSDAEIGAAARAIHKDCAAVIDRMFAIEPLSARQEGDAIEVPANYDPSQFRVIGNAGGQTPLRGKLAHPGWKAARSDVPAWTGRADAAMVIAPAEVEV